MVTSSNLSLQNSRLAIEQTKNSLKVARLGQQPNLTFSTSYNRNDEGAEDIVGAFVFNWPFIDGGATKARVRVLEEQLNRQEIDLWNQERELVQETYQDLRELQLQQQRIDILRQNVDQAFVNLENDLFIFTETGRISFRDMQDSQIELAQSRLNLTNAIVSYNLAQNSLMQKIHDYNPSEVVEPILGLLNPDKTSSNGLF
jgi:outer membrane protein TolC